VDRAFDATDKLCRILGRHHIPISIRLLPTRLMIIGMLTVLDLAAAAGVLEAVTEEGGCKESESEHTFHLNSGLD
jgi:hypothetical protein